MIGLDTNILLRAVLDDHETQSPQARRVLLSLGETRVGLVSLAVLLEFFWVLRSRYKLPRQRLVDMLRKLSEVEFIRLEASEIVGAALAAYESGGLDFADVVIALRNRQLGAEITYTFDKGAATAVPAMELLQ